MNDEQKTAAQPGNLGTVYNCTAYNCDVLETARPGDGVHTFGKISLWHPGASIIALGIQSAQLFGRWKGLPRIRGPFWKLTHSMLYCGTLSRAYIEGMQRASQLTRAQADELRTFDDWVLSQTHPVGVWVRLADIVEDNHGFLSRPRFCDFSQAWQRRALEHASWFFIGRRYDHWQLGGILANVLGETEPKEYRRGLDRSRYQTVCSGAVGAGYEAVRRQGIVRATGRHGSVEWITCETGREWPAEGGPEWWPRILNELHLEKYAPGHLCLPEWFEIAAEF